jgi:flagellar hook protein FlgE
MALSSALFSGISGLGTLGNAMQIIGDNISNVNTVGFKSSQFTFQDLLSQSVSTLAGTSQIGRGTALGDIYASFDQGSFETTGNTTDLAIGGEGFFVLREEAGNSLYYSRAGNFRFNKDGYLTNPEGYIAQGWELDADGDDIGSVTDILLSSFTSSPQESEKIQVIVNLDSEGDDNSTALAPADPDAALSIAWDGTDATPLGDNAYEYQTTLKVYDSLGSTHDVSIFFDKADTYSAYEFVVTCNPNEDQRAGASGNAWAGLLARGVIHFTPASGVIGNLDLWQINPATGASVAQAEATDLTDGFFTFAPDFLSGSPMNVGLDFGSRYDGTSWVNNSLSTTQFARASTTTFQSSDGYGAGDLQDINVDVDGVITGAYSNGQLIPLYRVALAKFQNNLGLFKEGGNLYKETRTSGDATTNRPGTNGLGSLAPNSLEQSNVDIATEFVKMITTQRGFQANSKVITVTDQMLSELINLKR